MVTYMHKHVEFQCGIRLSWGSLYQLALNGMPTSKQAFWSCKNDTEVTCNTVLQRPQGCHPSFF